MSYELIVLVAAGGFAPMSNEQLSLVREDP